MSFNYKHYVLALAVVTLDTASAQMCPGDHGKLTHNTEFNVTVTCTPGDPDTFLGFAVAESANAGPFSGHYAGGWCIDADRAIYCNTVFQVDAYSSYDQNIPSDAVDQPGNITRVNWLINHHPIGSTVEIDGCYTGELGWQEYQESVWELVDHVTPNMGAQDCIVEWLVEQAMLYGEGYQVSCDNSTKIGAIFVIDNSTNHITHQVVLAEIPVAEIDEICNCDATGYVMGDPHFKTWSGELYDFHGICDLTLIKNPQFMNGLGMDINVRSEKMKQFSYISTAAIRIGSETFEVAAAQGDGDTYWLNGELGGSDGVLDEGVAISGYSITFRQVTSHQREYVIHISENQQILFVTRRGIVRVDIKGARSDNFQGSLGLLGSFDEGGVKLGRDGVTVFDDVNEFGMEWQVLASETRLFHQADGPQHPEMCELPTKTSLRRRLAESLITQEEADLACSHVQGEERDLCIFDVMATNSKDVAGAY